MTGFTGTCIPSIMLYFGTKNDTGLAIPRGMTVHSFHQKATLPKDMTDSAFTLLKNKKANILMVHADLYYVNSYSHRCPGAMSDGSTSTITKKVDKKTRQLLTITTVTSTVYTDLADADADTNKDLADAAQAIADDIDIYGDDIVTPTKWKPVTLERTASASMYDDRSLTVQQILDRYYSLHAVKCEHNKWICDCKQYHKNGFVCAHTLAVMDITKEFDLGSNYSPLDEPKKKGRPKHHTPALQK